VHGDIEDKGIRPIFFHMVLTAVASVQQRALYHRPTSLPEGAGQ